MANTLRRLWLKSTDPARVGVWDCSPEHPGGEIFVAGEAVVEAAATPGVLEAIAARRVVEVPDPAAPAALPAPGRK